MEALEYKVILLERAKRLTLAKQTAKTLLMLGGEESKFLDMYGHALLLAGSEDHHVVPIAHTIEEQIQIGTLEDVEADVLVFAQLQITRPQKSNDCNADALERRNHGGQVRKPA